MATTTSAQPKPKPSVIIDTDPVRKDGVRKEQIFLEKFTQKRYNEKWGYMRNFNEVCLQIAKERDISEQTYRRVQSKDNKPKFSNSCTWCILPSDPKPITTSGEIGWRSSRSDCSLERLGPLYVSPKYTLDPPGTQPELPITNIKLG